MRHILHYQFGVGSKKAIWAVLHSGKEEGTTEILLGEDKRQPLLQKKRLNFANSEFGLKLCESICVRVLINKYSSSGGVFLFETINKVVCFIGNPVLGNQDHHHRRLERIEYSDYASTATAVPSPRLPFCPFNTISIRVSSSSTVACGKDGRETVQVFTRKYTR